MEKKQKFGLIKEIDVSDPETWEDRIFLTLDLDWAPDFVISEISDHLRSREVRATWFVTHSSKEVEKLKCDHLFEVGVHPNFSPCLMGADGAPSVHEVVNEMRELAPSATSFRCHSLVQSSPLLELMATHGFLFDCNTFLPFTRIDSLFPWRYYGDLVRVPYCWEDDTWISGACRDPGEVAVAKGLRVIDVHPVLLWLNWLTLDVYRSVKTDLTNEEKMRQAKNPEVNTGLIPVLDSMLEGIGK